jgi:hypothetical protein
MKFLLLHYNKLIFKKINLKNIFDLHSFSIVLLYFDT